MTHEVFRVALLEESQIPEDSQRDAAHGIVPRNSLGSSG